jgi:hypothetical protein
MTGDHRFVATNGEVSAILTLDEIATLKVPGNLIDHERTLTLDDGATMRTIYIKWDTWIRTSEAARRKWLEPKHG